MKLPSGIELEVCSDITERFGRAHENPLTLRQHLELAYDASLNQVVAIKRAISEIDREQPKIVQMKDGVDFLAPENGAKLDDLHKNKQGHLGVVKMTCKKCGEPWDNHVIVGSGHNIGVKCLSVGEPFLPMKEVGRRIGDAVALCKCSGTYQRGIALVPSICHHDDFGGDAGEPGTTMSEGPSNGKPQPCMKCEKCGNSYTI